MNLTERAQELGISLNGKTRGEIEDAIHRRDYAASLGVDVAGKDDHEIDAANAKAAAAVHDNEVTAVTTKTQGKRK